ncbi:MAG: GGDEF domain-containing protein [bacterium]
MISRWRAVLIIALLLSAAIGAAIALVDMPHRFIVADIIRIISATTIGFGILFSSKRRNVPERERRGWNWIGWATITFGVFAAYVMLNHFNQIPEPIKYLKIESMISIAGLLLIGVGLFLRHGRIRSAPINWTVTAVDMGLMVGAALLPFFMMKMDWGKGGIGLSIDAGTVLALLIIMIVLPLLQHRETPIELRTPGIVLLASIVLILISNDNLRALYQFDANPYSGLGSWVAAFLMLGIAMLWEFDAHKETSSPELMSDVAYGVLSEMLPLLAMFTAVIFVFLALTNDMKRNYEMLIFLTMLLFLTLIRRILAYLQMRGTVEEVRIQVSEIEQAVVTDTLTGLANRRFLMQRMQEELSRAKRFNRPVAMIFFDIDFFKMVNDVHGHDNGDLALCHIANILRKAIRTTDIVSRLGGEEFVILLPDTTQSTATMLAERLRHLVEISILTLSDGVELNMTISGGVSAYPETSEEGDELLKAADTAMNHAKNSGRNRIFAAPAKQRMYLRPAEE